MEGTEKHLSQEQLEELSRGSVSPVDLAPPRELVDARRHLAACAECRRVLEMYSRFERSLGDLRIDIPGKAQSGCPSIQTLNDVAAGIKAPREAEEVIGHAAKCDHCGPLLRQATEDFAKELTAEEESFLARLPIAQPAAQQELSKRLSPNSEARTARKSAHSSVGSAWRAVRAPWWVYAMATALAALGVTVFAWSRWHTSAAYVDTLVARSYAEQRTIEMRIDGAPYTPLKVHRGANNSNISRPPSLLEAELLISKNLGKHPSDPAWLRAKAQADLIDGNFDSAIQSLQQALQVQPKSARLLTDLGSAHFEQGEALGNSLEYGTAIELFGKALREVPDDPVALFNQAVALERAKLFAQAIEDWEHYLRIDSRGAWADDARTRLAALRSRMKEHSDLSSLSLYTPTELLKAVSSDGHRIRAVLDLQIEEYLSRVVRDWLADGFPSKAVPKTDADVLDAMKVVAEVAHDEHHDAWLSDLLSRTNSAVFAKAVAALSQAAKSNDRADYDAARRQAETAKRLFADSGNVAGLLRAQLEMTFSYHFSREAELCLRSLKGAEAESRNRSYRWLLVQFKLERSICAGLTGDLGDSARIADEALVEARVGGYRNVYLRAVGLAADLSAEVGDLRGGWDKASAGLGEFWSGTHNPMVGYNLYTDLDTVADMSGQRYLQVAIWKQALPLIDSDPDLLLRAMAHRWMAGAAYSAGIAELAKKEFAEASRLFASAPETDGTRNDRAEAEIWLARLEIQGGQGERAAARLKNVEDSLSSTANNFVAIRFYEAECELELSLNNLDKSEESARKAIQLAELSLASLRSETDRLAWRRNNSDSYRALVDLRIRRGDISGALDEWEWYKGAFERTVRTNENQPEIVRGLVQKSLPKLNRTSILSVGLLPSGIAVWLFDDRGVTGSWKKIPPAEVIDLAGRFSQLCSDPGSDIETMRTVGRSLYDLMVNPIASRLQAGRELVVELDERLATLPVEALVDTNGRYLGESTAVVSSPGLFTQERLRDSSQISRESAALIVAVPAGAGPQMFPLPDTVEEARMVSDFFPNGEVVIGSRSKTIDFRGELAKSEIFHFAGHSISAGSKTGLVLGGDTTSGNLQLFDATALDSNSVAKLKLVVVSACSSAVGGSGHADDMDAVVGGFLRLGVPHVIGSRWRIDSATTTSFMRTFYSKLLQGDSIAGALQGTEADFRSNNRTIHPYYWSAFEVFGRS